MGVIGKVISGGFGKVIVRQKASEVIELGELLVSETPSKKLILQVYDLLYGSQLSQQNLELVSGLKLEENSDLELMDFSMRNYPLALLKGVLEIQVIPKMPKTLPIFFSDVRRLEEKDIPFFSSPKNPVFLGNLRSGTKTLNIEVCLPGDKALTHHILISAQTGKGKSNLAKVLLYKATKDANAGFLVLDPHDEYFGRHEDGLKNLKKTMYFSPSNPPPGSRQLILSLNTIKPSHLEGAMYLSDPQWQAIAAYSRAYKEDWVESLILEKELKVLFNEATINVVKRKLMQLLDIRIIEGKLVTKGIFSTSGGNSTVRDIVNEIENAKTVIIDTSSFSKNLEVLIGSIISSEIFKKYKRYKQSGQLKDKPAISIVIEEAPRVLGKDVLEKGSNIFSTIAREGRKFKIGLIAITQLPSLIPRDILANMNTKIILGTEMANERAALIASAAQDLTSDDRTIASLDTGEAIVTSSFLKMAVPIKIPLFKPVEESNQKINYPGLK